MYSAKDEIELTRDLLIAMGIEIHPISHALIDQETKSQLNFENKIIKANNDPNKDVYITEYDIKLEPANPKCTKLMERLFGRFIDAEVEMENIPEMQAYYFDKDEESNKYRLVIKRIDGVKWLSNWYYNKIICYVEAILSIDGTFVDRDLVPFDIPQDEREDD